MNDLIDITDPLHEICNRLNLVPNNVRTLMVTASSPPQAIATVYKLRDGHKYVDGTGWPAVETRTYEVRT